MTNILILSAGRRVSLLRGFQEAAAKIGAGVFAADMSPSLSAACRIAERRFELPHVLDDSYSAALEELCRENAVSLAVPTIDTELPVLARLRERFEEKGINLVVSDSALIADCADKRRTAKLFERHGLPAPELYGSREEIVYPVLVKPYDGALSKGVFIVKNGSEMSDAILKNEKNIYCEYIDHEFHDEYTCDLYYDRESRLKCAVPRRRLQVRDGEVNKALTVKNEIVALLFERLGHLSGARGCITVQLFRNRHTGAHRFIEINPRFGGGYPLSRLAGADFQAWLIDEYMRARNVPVFHGWEDRLLMLRYDGEVIASGYDPG